MVIEFYCFKTRINTKNQIIKTQKNLLFNITKLKVNKMKTTCAIVTILVSVLLSQTAKAELRANRSTIQLESSIGINIETEIDNNISLMLANIQVPVIKAGVVKQLDIDTVQSQTNELVLNVTETLPEFKFKVVIAE